MTQSLFTSTRELKKTARNSHTVEVDEGGWRKVRWECTTVDEERTSSMTDWAGSRRTRKSHRKEREGGKQLQKWNQPNTAFSLRRRHSGGRKDSSSPFYGRISRKKKSRSIIYCNRSLKTLTFTTLQFWTKLKLRIKKKKHIDQRQQ